MQQSHDGSTPAPVIDVVAIGETMAAFIRDGADDCYRLTAIGAESNVAVGLAQLGCRSRWVSRLGDDEMGAFISNFLSSQGVDVDVDWDSHHSTGVCVKELGSDRTRVRYYRSESAARHLSGDHVARLGPAPWVHITGITPALSQTAANAIILVAGRELSCTRRVSFDVNYRPGLWPDAATAAQVLIPLARSADLVFIGDDEAEVLMGSCSEDELRDQLLAREGQELVLKRGGGYATVITATDRVSEPALDTKVVDVTGAGDAFSAGYLAACCRGQGLRERLRLGHFLASRVLRAVGDLSPAIDTSERDHLLSTSTVPLLTRTGGATA